MAEPATADGDSPVFLLSTPRSGSGVLQRALNCHPGLVMWGEHFGFLASMVTALVQMKNPVQRHYPLRPGDNRGPERMLPTLRDPSAALEWVNPWSMQEYVAALRRFVDGYFATQRGGKRRWGFREVRYNTPAALRGLQLLYPQARFVFLLRDVSAVAEGRVQAAIEGGSWRVLDEQQQRQRIGAWLREADAQFRVLREFAVTEPEAATVVSFEQLMESPGAELTRLVQRLGLSEGEYDQGTALRAVTRGTSTLPSSRYLRALIDAVRTEARE